MKDVTISSESWRTPEELEILEFFDFCAGSGHQWQLWHKGNLKDTFWKQEDARHASEHFYASPRFHPVFRWNDHWTGEHYEVEYSNLEIQAPGGVRWMTTNTFVLRVATVSATSCC